MSKPDANTYALLGLLDRHPWSAYELTAFMRQSMLRAVWPRAESRIYEGLKKLVKLGFATSDEQMTGKRKRTIYTITKQGREALAHWALEPGRDVIFEHEALLKLAYADQHGPDGLRRVLENIRASTERDALACAEGFDMLAEQLREADANAAPPPANRMVNAFTFLVLQARLDWLQRADALLQTWEDLDPDESKCAEAVEFYREGAGLLRQRLELP